MILFYRSLVILYFIFFTNLVFSQFVSINGRIVNVREQPNTKSQINWELIRGYPLQIIETKGNWIKVKDFESTLGWVHKPLTSKTGHYIVKAKTVNLRSSANTNSKVVTKLEKYDIVKTIEKKNNWIKVSKDKYVGWIRQDLIWGF